MLVIPPDGSFLSERKNIVRIFQKPTNTERVVYTHIFDSGATVIAMEKTLTKMVVLPDHSVEIQYLKADDPQGEPIAVLRSSKHIQFSHSGHMISVVNDPSSVNVTISFPRNLFTSTIMFSPVSPGEILERETARLAEVVGKIPRVTSQRAFRMSKSRSVSLLDSQETIAPTMVEEQLMEVGWEEKRPRLSSN